MHILLWLRHPVSGYHRLRYWVWEKRHPDLPWLCPGTVRFCDHHLTKSMKALEFGSGRSTRWFAGRVRHLTSVEHVSSWHEQVKMQLEQAGVANVDYRLVPLNYPPDEGERAEYDPLPDYVAICAQFPDASLDFVIVDGHYRTHCVRQAVAKVKPGGYLLVDDINFWPAPEALPIPKSWRIVDDSTNGLKRCIIWQAAALAG